MLLYCSCIQVVYTSAHNAVTLLRVRIYSCQTHVTFFFFFLILRQMGKNKALAHHTSTHFHTRRVSANVFVSLTVCLGGVCWGGAVAPRWSDATHSNGPSVVPVE